MCCTTVGQESVSHRLQETQYGFRANRSTAQALYIARRIQDLAEAAHDNTILFFLDGGGAFDKVDQDRMIEALKIIGITNNMYEAVRARYDNVDFFVKAERNASQL